MTYPSLRAILLLILILSSCGPSTSEGKKRAALSPAPVSLWYLLTPEGGRFLPREALFTRFPTPPELLLPWVNQLRVSDFFLREGRFFLGINGLGLGEIVIEGEPRVVIHRDSHTFAGRTLGGLFPLREGILIQLYGDSVFNPTIRDVLPPLWYFDLQADHFVEVSGREGHGDRGWELVELLPLGEARLERWKKNDGQTISFRYLRYSPSPDSQGGSEEVLEKETFRRHALPPPLAEASRAIRSGWALMGVSEDSERIRDLVFPGGTGTARAIRLPGSLPEDARGYSRLPSVVDRGTLTTLFPREGILRTSQFPQEPLSLPMLPPACRYTALGAVEKWWILGWEEIVFLRVGASGLLFIPRDYTQ